MCVAPLSTQGSSWGYLKSQFSRDLVNFGRYMPTKWLQERAKGSKNGHGIPPHRAFCGTRCAPPPRPPRPLPCSQSSSLLSLSVYIYTYLIYVDMHVYIYIYLSVHLSIYLSVCSSTWDMGVDELGGPGDTCPPLAGTRHQTP